MEYASLRDLYNKLIPVFNVKKRVIKHSKYPYITNEDIWKYLVEAKWKKAINLKISEMVNDIITVDLEKINRTIPKNRKELSI